MRMMTIEKHFPELSSLPRSKQEETLERARYETFTTQGSIGKWFRSSLSMLIFGILVGVVISLALMHLFDIEPFWISGIVGGCGGGLGSYLQQKLYIKQIQPKVHELSGDREI